MLQSMGLQRVGCNLATERRQQLLLGSCVNPDPLMQQAIDEIVARGWFEVKEEYLLNADPHFEETRVILTEAEDAPGLSDIYTAE